MTVDLRNKLIRHIFSHGLPEYIFSVNRNAKAVNGFITKAARHFRATHFHSVGIFHAPEQIKPVRKEEFDILPVTLNVAGSAIVQADLGIFFYIANHFADLRNSYIVNMMSTFPHNRRQRHIPSMSHKRIYNNRVHFS